MAVEEFQGFTYTCDRCGKMHMQQNASGHYTNSTPPDWGRVKYTPSSEARIPMKPFDYLICDNCIDEYRSFLSHIEQGVLPA